MARSVAASPPQAEQAGRGSQLKRPRALAASRLQRPLEFGLDLVLGASSAARNSARSRRASASQREASNPIAPSAAASPVRASPATAQASSSTRIQLARMAGRVVGPARLVQRPLDARDPRGCPAVEDVDVAGKGLGVRTAPAIPPAPRAPAISARRVLANALRVAQVEREHGGEHEHGRLGERVRDLVGQRQRRIPRPHCRLGVSQEPEGVAEAAEADHFRIRP